MSAQRRLKLARKRRHQAAARFHALSNGNATLSDVLRDPPACLQRIRVYDVIRRTRRMGDDGADTVLKRAKVWPTKKLGDLTEQEVEAIIDRLPPRALRGSAEF